jgi:hypothetical protein
MKKKTRRHSPFRRVLVDVDEVGRVTCRVGDVCVIEAECCCVVKCRKTGTRKEQEDTVLVDVDEVGRVTCRAGGVCVIEAGCCCVVFKCRKGTRGTPRERFASSSEPSSPVRTGSPFRCGVTRELEEMWPNTELMCACRA